MIAGPGGDVRPLLPWRLCAAGQAGPVVPMCAGKAAERLGFCRAHVGEGLNGSQHATDTSSLLPTRGQRFTV